MLLDLIVQIHYMKDIEKLSLILMQSLNLYIEDGVRVYVNTVVLLDILGQTYLVLVLDSHKAFSVLLVVRSAPNLTDLRKICNPTLSYLVCYPVCKQWIGMKKESSLSNTVGLVVELLREDLIEVLKLLILQNLCVKSCNTVNRIACNNGKMSHLYLTIVHNCHLTDLLICYSRLSRILHLDKADEATVDLFNNLIYTWKET